MSNRFCVATAFDYMTKLEKNNPEYWLVEQMYINVLICHNKVHRPAYLLIRKLLNATFKK